MSKALGLVAAVVLLVVAALCSCSDEQITVDDYIVVGAHIEAANIPRKVTEGQSIRVSLRTVEGCRFGEWEGTETSFEGREIHVATRARLKLSPPEDCTPRREIREVRITGGTGDKGSKPLPSGTWTVFLEGRNTVVTGQVTIE